MLSFSTIRNIGFFFIFSLSLVLVSSIKSGEIDSHGSEVFEGLPDGPEFIDQYSSGDGPNFTATWNARIGELSSKLVSAVMWISDWYQDKYYCPNGKEGSYDTFQGDQAVTIYTKMWATGINCHHIAERDTITGSMWKYIKDHHKNDNNKYIRLPEAECVYVDHGSTIHYLSYGTDRDKVYGQDCVKKMWDKCQSKRKIDL